MMATERKKVVTDKFIHNLINISDEKQAKVQKVYFLESQYFIVPSQHHNISCMWLTASLDILIIENFTDLFKNIFCMIKTWWFFLPFNWLKENNKLSSSKSNLPWFILIYKVWSIIEYNDIISCLSLPLYFRKKMTKISIFAYNYKF